MRKKNERTLKMEQEFMSLHNQGMSVYEIAKKFNLHYTTVYAYLSDIAAANGCTREDLLKIVQGPHSTYCRDTFEPVPEVDVAQYRKKFSQLKAGAKELSSLMSDYIGKNEEA